ncbi:MAG: YfiR family protein [Bacteroidia bacterium]
MINKKIENILSHGFRRSKLLFKAAVCFAVLFLCGSFQGNNEISEPTIKALFIYNFTKYVEWPVEKDPAHIIIGFYGPSAIIDELKKVCANKKVKDREVEIRQANDVNEAEKCDIFFIPQDESADFSYLNEQLQGKGVLIVTEEDGLGQKGAAINIIEKDDKIRFELNEASIKHAGLKISSQLLALAIKL